MKGQKQQSFGQSGGRPSVSSLVSGVLPHHQAQRAEFSDWHLTLSRDDELYYDGDSEAQQW